MYTEEIEWCLRIKKAGFKIFYTPSAFVYHLKNGSFNNSNENAIISEYKGLIHLFKKHKPKWELIFLPYILKLGAFLRILRFSIIKDKRKMQIYAKAFKLV